MLNQWTYAGPLFWNGTSPMLLEFATTADPRTGDLEAPDPARVQPAGGLLRVDQPQLVLLHDPEQPVALQDAATVTAVGAWTLPHATPDRPVEVHASPGGQADSHQLARPLAVALAVSVAAEPRHVVTGAREPLGHEVAPRAGQPDAVAERVAVGEPGELLARVRPARSRAPGGGRSRCTGPWPWPRPEPGPGSEPGPAAAGRQHPSGRRPRSWPAGARPGPPSDRA